MLSLASPHLPELTIASTQILYQLSVVASARDRLGSYLPLEREVEVMLPVYHQNKVLFHQGTWLPSQTVPIPISCTATAGHQVRKEEEPYLSFLLSVAPLEIIKPPHLILHFQTESDSPKHSFSPLIQVQSPWPGGP